MISTYLTVFFLAGNVLSVDGSFLFILVCILALIFLLNRTLFAPINAILDERERLGAGRIHESQRMLKQYEQRLAQYEQEIGKARAEAYQLLENQRKASLQARQDLLAQVKQETAQQIDAAKAAITQQTAAARTSLESEARAMANTISSRILQN